MAGSEISPEARKPPMKLDLYLVTDSTQAILGDGDLFSIVENAIKGGVTIVQYRDKHSDTGVLIKTAERLHAVTQSHNVPLIINDRVDVALAIGAEGVHLGQDDMPIGTARRILGKKSIIGVSANNIEEAQEAVKSGADYLGLGAVYATPTKSDTKSILGPYGIQAVLEALSSMAPDLKDIPTVAIGGINQSNAGRIFFQSCSTHKSLSGLAVVTAIIASQTPYEAAANLRKALATHELYSITSPGTFQETLVSSLLDHVPSIISHHTQITPLSHNMTNTVVQNFAANVCLATGSSPIMSTNGHEASALAQIPNSALVVNMGTLTPDLLTHYKLALTAYNAAARPTLLDPVGAGATPLRRSTLADLLAHAHFTCIKGNESEICTAASILLPDHPFFTHSQQQQQRGVDSAPTRTPLPQLAQLISHLSLKTHSLILLTGATDLLAHPITGRVLALSNGHPFLGQITGSGCALGSVIAAFMAAWSEDKFEGAVAAVCLYGVAAEEAVGGGKVEGPGGFVPAFLDALWKVNKSGGKEVGKWAKVEFVDFES
ncbi:MAG: hypothetical protein Q9227_008724 [Pyrenula ochraceoflavens]